MVLSSSNGKFRGIFRNASARCAPWNYTSPGAYFVTINALHRIPWFGTVQSGFVCLSDIGAIVADEWLKTPVIRPYVTLDAWVVMPDHMHGIIVMHRRPDAERIADASRRYDSPMARFKSHTLGSILNQFKSICTKRIWRSGYPDFAWQPRFHDRMVRDATALRHVRAYIRDNPRRSGS